MRGFQPISRVIIGALIAAGVAAATAGLVTAVGTGPLARWQFDETSGSLAADAVGALDGTNAGASSVLDGVVGRAFRFDGADRVTIPDGSAFHGDRMHLDFFIRGDAATPPADGQVIMEKGDVLCGADGAGFALVVDGGGIAVEYLDKNAATRRYRMDSFPATGYASIWDGAWHHVSFVTTVPERPGESNTSLAIDGWGRGSGPHLNSDGVDVGDRGGDPLVVGDDDRSCGANFVGDIDQLRLFDYVLELEEYAEDEPIVATSISIDSIGASAVDAGTPVMITLSPPPTRPGRLCVDITAEDGIERHRGCHQLYGWNLDVDGEYQAGFTSDHGGPSTYKVTYESAWPSYLSSESSAPIVIAKKATTARIALQHLYVADEPISLGIVVVVDRPVQVTGMVELWDVTGPTDVKVASGALQDTDGTIYGVFDTTLPARPAGTYRFEARYFGSVSYLPSVSAETEVVIESGLDAGPVVLDGGAATTNDPVVSLSMPATGATAIWVSTGAFEGDRSFTDPYDDLRDIWLTSPSQGDDRDGVRTVWVRWADALGRWSATQSDTIVLDRGIPKGTVAINGGASWTASREVSLAAPIADPSQVLALEVSHDGISWWPRAYAASIPWTLLPGEGVRSVHVRWKDLAGRSSMPVSDSIVVDSTAPRVTTLSLQQPAGATVTDRVPMRVAWGGSDQGGGPVTYEVQERVESGAWTAFVTSTSARSTVRSWRSGLRYEYRVRAKDQAGKVSDWRTATGRRATASTESSSRLAYRGTWRSGTSTRFWGGTARWADRAGASVTATVTGRSIAWVATVGPTRGKAKVYVDGAYLRTVDLYAPKTGAARIVFVQEWSSTATRRVTITVVGTAGRPRVDMDGIISVALS